MNTIHTLKELEIKLISMAPDLENKDIFERTPREGEIANLRTAVAGMIEAPEEVEGWEIEKVRYRVSVLLIDGQSAGRQGEILKEMKNLGDDEEIPPTLRSGEVPPPRDTLPCAMEFKD